MADTSNTDSSPSSGTGDISLYAPLRVMLQNRYLVAAAAVVVALVAVVPALVGPRSYTASAAFMPQGSGASSSLAAFAGQFGLNIGQGEPAQSPQLYAEIAQSRELLGRLLDYTFVVEADPDSERPAAGGSLSDILQIEAADPERRRERTVSAVADMLSVTTTATGMVRLEVTSVWPDLSEAVTARLIELINEFNLQTRQSRAAAESRFVQDRLAETEASLRRTEDELRRFLEANRQFQNSPQLLFEHDRLQRELRHQQQLYTGLQESYENARIAQVRDTPLITVVAPPRRPVYPDSRRIPLRALLGLFVGGMIGTLIAFLREFIAKGPGGKDPEYLMLQNAWMDTLGDLRLARRSRTSPEGGFARREELPPPSERRRHSDP